MAPTAPAPDDAEGQRAIERSLRRLRRDPDLASTFAILAPHPLPSWILVYLVTEMKEATSRGDLKEKLGASKSEWLKFIWSRLPRPGSSTWPRSCADDGLTDTERTSALWHRARQRERIKKRKAGPNESPSSLVEHYSTNPVVEESTDSST